MKRSASPAIDVMIESPLWQPDAEAVVRRAIAAAASAVHEGSSGVDPLERDGIRKLLHTFRHRASGELAIVLADDSAIRALNRDWRGMDKATNVLSFPAAKSEPDDEAPQLGDIMIAYETTAREAASEYKPFNEHLAHLAIHGFLHLLGYDHETDREADAMERLETVILARLGVPNPYAVREPSI
jgi:probable rRNA maturation factor